MTHFAEWFAPTLLRASVALAIAAIVVAACVKLLRLRSPAAEQVAWLLVLVQGVLFFSFSIPVSSEWFSASSAVTDSSESAAIDLTMNSMAPRAPIVTDALVESFDHNLQPDQPAVVSAATDDVPMAVAPPARFRLPAWPLAVCVAWLVGAITIVLAGVAKYVQFVRRLQFGAPATGELECEWRRMCKVADVRAEIPLMVTKNLGPALCRAPGGYRLAVPAQTWEVLSVAERSAIYRHELEHYRRGDLWWTLAAKLLATVHWFNPFAWWAARRFEAQGEFACDAAAAGDNPAHFSELLVQLAVGGSPRIAGVQPVAATSVYERVQRLLTGRSHRASWRVIVPVAIAVVALFFAAIRFEPIDSSFTAVAAMDDPQAAAPADAVEQAPEQQVKAPSDVAPDEIAGVVVDEDGNPVAGALVDVYIAWPGNETRTDEHGVFRLRGFDNKEKMEVRITKDNFSPAYFPQQEVGAKGWTVVLSDKTYIEGTVTGADGKPATGGEIRAAFGPVRLDGATRMEVVTLGKIQPDGKYRLYLKPETYDLQFASADQGVKRLSKVVVRTGEAKTFDITLEPGVRFEARVVDSETGGPVENFAVYQWRPSELFGRSDAEGRIVLTGLPPGEIELQCGWTDDSDHRVGRYYSHGPFGRWWSEQAIKPWQRKSISDPELKWQRNFDGLAFDLYVGMPPVEIVVERGVTISGRVTDPDGNPVAGATVAPAKTGSGNSLTGDTRYSVVTKEDGAYSVVLPASNAAKYNLIAHDGKFGEWRRWANGVREPIQTTPGQVIENYDLQLTQPAVARGRVIKDGKPAADLQVRTHAFDKNENRYYDPTTRTDRDGKFELKFVRPGKHYLQAEPFWLNAEDSPGGWKIVEVQAGQVLEGQELVAVPPNSAPARPALPPGMVALQARVVDPDGKPVEGASAGVGARGGALAYRASVIAHTAGGHPGFNIHVPGTNAEGIIDLGAVDIGGSILSRLLERGKLIYAVDIAGKRAGIAELKPPDRNTADSKTVNVTVRPVRETSVRLRFDDILAKAFTENELALPLSITRDGIPLQELLGRDGGISLLLPEGEYEISGQDWHTQRVQLAFTVTADAGAHVDIEVKPSRLARLIGESAPELTELKPSETANPTLSSLKGRVVLLEFWGHWCGPCVAKMPNLVQLHEEFEHRGLSVIAVHDDSVRSYEKLKPILERLERERWGGKTLPFPVVLDDGGKTTIEGADIEVRGATTANYGIMAWPTTVLIDRKGRVRGIVELGNIEAARERLRELLAEAAPSD